MLGRKKIKGYIELEWKSIAQAFAVVLFIVITTAYAWAVEGETKEDIELLISETEDTGLIESVIREKFDYSEIEKAINSNKCMHEKKSALVGLGDAAENERGTLGELENGTLGELENGVESVIKSKTIIHTEDKHEQHIEYRELMRVYFSKDINGVNAVLRISVDTSSGTLYRQVISEDIEDIEENQEIFGFSIGDDGQLKAFLGDSESYKTQSLYNQYIDLVNESNVIVICRANILPSMSVSTEIVYMYMDNGYDVVMELGVDNKICSIRVI